MTSQTKVVRVGYVVLSLTGFAMCGCLGRPDTPVESESSAIINGTPVTADSLGTPALTIPAGLCSGTLLTDQWILTAHHCATNEVVKTGGTALNAGSITATMLNGDVAHGTAVFLHSSADVALVHLDRSLLNGAGLPFENPLFLGSATSLVNGTVFCQGWGDNDANGQGSGQLRSASVVVSSANTSTFQVAPNNFSQVPAHGDSGSSCFVTIDNVPRVAGVVSTAAFDGNQLSFATLVSIDAFRDWAEGIIGNAATLFSDSNFFGRAQALVPGPAGRSWDVGQLTVGNDAMSSLTVPTNWFVTLFKDAGFTTLLAIDTVSTSYVSGDGINDQVSSVVIGGQVNLFQGINLQNQFATFGSAGRFTLSGGILDNATSSLTVPAGWRVQLFDHPDFTGQNATFNEGTYLFVGWGFNDLASSVIVEQPLEVYTNPNFLGGMGRLLPGCYGWNALGVPNDSIRSIAVPSGMTVQVWTDGQFGGSTTTFRTSTAQMPSGFDNSISSICVYRDLASGAADNTYPAMSGSVSQSTTAFGGVASRAIDGNTSGDWNQNSVTHTDFGPQPWWQVDLGAIRFVKSIDVYNRTDCCADRLTNFNVMTSTDGISWSSTNIPGTAGTPTQIALGPQAIGTQARFVQVQLAGSNFLSLAEVNVWGF